MSIIGKPYIRKQILQVKPSNIAIIDSVNQGSTKFQKVTSKFHAQDGCHEASSKLRTHNFGVPCEPHLTFCSVHMTDTHFHM